jgi:enoyl-CoA hydratase/3-hydroxyacyl-CoA dehydrogenase
MDIKTVGIVGCGLMGAGIAQTAAEGGYTTIVRELTPELLEKGLGRIRGSLDKGVEKGKLAPARRDQVWARIKGATDLADLADCDLIIEAIVEVRDAKLALFAELDRVCKPDTIFATNTSSFKVADMAAQTHRPHLVTGLHYFFPALINKLLEVTQTTETPPEVVDALMNFARSTGKIPILVHDAPGFAVNRFFVPWLNEAVRLLDEGVADIPTIDAAACEAFGIGIGPFGLINATGDIAYHAAVSLGESLGEFYAPAAGLRKQFESRKPWDTTAGTVDSALYPTPKKQPVADRLLGVTFSVAAKLVEEGVATMEDTDRGATVGLRWAKGPFAMMNDLGPKRSLALAEAIESQWPGFVPRLLRSQRKPWVLRDVRLSIEGPLAIITMSRPDALNALNGKVFRELKETLGTVGKNRDVRAVVITGEGNAFVAGADIKEMQALAERPEAIRAFTDFGQSVLKDIEALPQPVIVAINGLALGGGLELALACDIRLASSDARLGFPEVGLGIFPGLGGTQRAARLIGRGAASELIFTGDPINADEAARLGLVNRVVPPAQLMAEARKLAGRIASRAPVAVAKAKAAIHATQQLPLDKGLVFEVDRVSEAFASPDRAEGMQAFIEKRKPVFTGREARKAGKKRKARSKK